MEKLLKAQTHNAVKDLSEFPSAHDYLDAVRSNVYKADLKDEDVPKKTHSEFLKDVHQNRLDAYEANLKDVHKNRSDVHEADVQEEIEQRDAAKVNFEQLYWETIPEDSQASLDQPFSFPISNEAVSTLYLLRNLSFPLPFKKPAKMLLKGRKEDWKKRMPNSCIVYQTQSLSRLLPTRF
jgi:hypothetical protein